MTSTRHRALINKPKSIVPARQPQKNREPRPPVAAFYHGRPAADRFRAPLPPQAGKGPEPQPGLVLAHPHVIADHPLGTGLQLAGKPPLQTALIANAITAIRCGQGTGTETRRQ